MFKGYKNIPSMLKKTNHATSFLLPKPPWLLKASKMKIEVIIEHIDFQMWTTKCTILGFHDKTCENSSQTCFYKLPTLLQLTKINFLIVRTSPLLKTSLCIASTIIWIGIELMCFNMYWTMVTSFHSSSYINSIIKNVWSGHKLNTLFFSSKLFFIILNEKFQTLYPSPMLFMILHFMCGHHN
jgi:hypothetical protein